MAVVGARRGELDSLRGVAAVSVLFYHVLALNFVQLNRGTTLQDVRGVAANLATYTPLHLLWLGAESVLFFFVLSGFVLTRAAGRPNFSFGAYVPGRLARLYIPVTGAVGLALLAFLVPHVPRPGIDPGLATDYPVQSVLADLTLVAGTSPSVGVLWSLQWEVVFSLLLPLYLVVGRRRPLLSILVALALCLIGWLNNSPGLSYLPVFFFGVALAQNWPAVERRFAFLRRGTPMTHLVGIAILLLSIAGLTSFFLLGRWILGGGLSARTITMPLVLASILLVMILAQLWSPFTRLLRFLPLRFLGMISFSLYLVHLPIVVTAIFVFGPGARAGTIAAATSLLVAVAFYYLIEKPSHRLAKLINRRMSTTKVFDGNGAVGPEPGNG